MSDPEIEVVPASRDDASTIAAFNAEMARETEGKTLDATRLLAGVAAVFADPSRGRYFVARRAGAVEGCLMVTYEWSDWRNATFWWIQSVYVRPDARRGGVYRAMHEAVRAHARAAGACGLRLYVERENEVAQRVYARVGMHEACYRMFEEDYVLGDAATRQKGSS